MKDYTKILTLEEIIAQGAFLNNEKKWRRVKRKLNGMEYKRLEDHQGFYYGKGDDNDSAFDDEIDESALYRSDVVGGIGDRFTGFSYELYDSGELESYTYYENGHMIAVHRFHKNGNIALYSRLGIGHIEFDEQGKISGQFGKFTKGYKGKDIDEERANVLKRFGTFETIEKK